MAREYVIAIVAALISSSFDPLFKSMLAPVTNFKTFLRFIFVYGVPVALIVWFMFGSFKVDEYFIFVVAFNFFAIAVNFSTYIQNTTNKYLIKASNLSTRLANLSTAQWESMGDLLKYISDLHDSTEAMKKEIKLIKEEIVLIKNPA
ncbi:MAG TPA: hypothetical protein VK543_11510 [Puia sp.]|nr:hypothetical protein [Puia sp.]